MLLKDMDFENGVFYFIYKYFSEWLITIQEFSFIINLKLIIVNLHGYTFYHIVMH